MNPRRRENRGGAADRTAPSDVDDDELARVGRQIGLAQLATVLAGNSSNRSSARNQNSICSSSGRSGSMYGSLSRNQSYPSYRSYPVITTTWPSGAALFSMPGGGASWPR